MGIDHGKKIKPPLRKPKAIDEIGSKKKLPFNAMQEFDKLMDNFKKKASKKAGESSGKTTITDTQKRGQVSPRYDLFDGRKRPLKKPTEKKVSPGSKGRKESRRSKSKNFLPHKIQQKLPTVRDAVYTFPEDKKPKFLRKKTSGSA